MLWIRRRNEAQSVTPSAPFTDQVISSLDVGHIMEQNDHTQREKGWRKQPRYKAEMPNTPFRNQSELGEKTTPASQISRPEACFECSPIGLSPRVDKGHTEDLHS